MGGINFSKIRPSHQPTPESLLTFQIVRESESIPVNIFPFLFFIASFNLSTVASFRMSTEKGVSDEWKAQQKRVTSLSEPMIERLNIVG